MHRIFKWNANVGWSKPSKCPRNISEPVKAELIHAWYPTIKWNS